MSERIMGLLADFPNICDEDTSLAHSCGLLEFLVSRLVGQCQCYTSPSERRAAEIATCAFIGMARQTPTLGTAAMMINSHAKLSLQLHFSDPDQVSAAAQMRLSADLSKEDPLPQLEPEAREVIWTGLELVEPLKRPVPSFLSEFEDMDLPQSNPGLELVRQLSIASKAGELLSVQPFGLLAPGEATLVVVAMAELIGWEMGMNDQLLARERAYAAMRWPLSYYHPALATTALYMEEAGPRLEDGRRKEPLSPSDMAITWLLPQLVM